MTTSNRTDQESIAACLKGLPPKIKIGAYDWAIVIETEGQDTCGQVDFAIRHIQIWPANLTDAGHAVGVFLHECLHVIYANHLEPLLRTKKKGMEEPIVAGIESGLIAMYRDNPWLLRWMNRWLKRNSPAGQKPAGPVSLKPKERHRKPDDEPGAARHHDEDAKPLQDGH